MMNVVTITGGNGGRMLLSELKKIKNINITSIVSAADDGGSTGRIRDELDVLPPGDARQCAIALSNLPEKLSASMDYRFKKGFLKGHSLGNILIAGLEEERGDFRKGFDKFSDFLKLSGKIVPASLRPTVLRVRLKNKKIIEGEHNISQSNDLFRLGIEKLYLNKNNQPNPEAIAAIKKADLIILGPGNFYCSLIPILLVENISSSIEKAKAKIFFISNLTNKEEHTAGFFLEDYVEELNKYLGKNRIDFVIANNKFPKTKDEFIMPKNKNTKNNIIEASLLSSRKRVYEKTDSISHLRSSIIHDGKKLTEVIMKTYNKIK